MNRSSHNTFRSLRTLSLTLALLTLLLVSSTQGVVEECSQETVSQEIELVLVRREEPSAEKSDSVSSENHPDAQTLRTARPFYNRFFMASTERGRMNGSGTYLLI